MVAAAHGQSVIFLYFRLVVSSIHVERNLRVNGLLLQRNGSRLS
jgi:hypothetical protein